MSNRNFIFSCIAVAFLLLVSSEAVAQPQSSGNQSSAEENASSQTIPDEWMDHFTWRSIGPANMSGRITSIAVYEQDPRIWYIASASGGLLKTTNNGTDFEHIFDDQATVSIGDVQVHKKNPDIVWVGTGEANPRNSVSWGNGVYKSTDGGKTWKNMGLKKSFQIGRIAIHPENPDIVYVGALGRLWGPNEQRGLFKTTDGGENWEKIHFIDENTGVIDIKMHPKDPDTLLFATYERMRDGFDGNDPVKKYGEGSGLYRTSDGGKTIEKVTEGLPSCNLGRIGLDWYQKNPKFVYAIIESEKIASVPENRGYAGFSGESADVGAKITDVVEDSPSEKAGLKVDDIVVQVDGDLVHSYEEFLAELRRRKAGDDVKLAISRDRKPVEVVVTLDKAPEPRARTGRGGRGGGARRNRSSEFTGTLGGQAANLQGQQGGENEEEYGGIYMSKDAGASWTRINTLNPRPMYYSQIRVDPSNKDNLYVLGTSLYKSSDGGETFTGDGGRGVHPDNHAMWIDPDQGDHMILGNDGGIYVTYDRMANWDHHNHIAIGQFYHVGIDHNRNYKVYGGLQDNGSWGGPAQSREGGPVNTDWFRVGGGDGFITLVDPDDPDQIFAESQNGAMSRINLRTGDRGFIRPRPPRGTRYRFNWKTPFVLSPHNSKIHYSAGNYVFRSYNKGDGIKAISPEITNTDKGSGSAISESPVTAGVVYVGTTDGAVWMTRDDGQNWEEIFVQREPSEEETRRTASTESGSDVTTATGEASRRTSESASDRAEGDAAPGERGARRRGQRGNRPRRGAGAPGGGDAKGRGDRPRRERDSAATGETSEEAGGSKTKAETEARESTEEKEASSSEGVAPKKEQPAKKDTEASPESDSAAAAKLVGTWKGQMDYDQLPEDQRWVELKIEQGEDGKLKGEFTTPRSVSTLTAFSFDVETGDFSFKGSNDTIKDVVFECGLDKDGSSINGQLDMGRFKIDFEVKKSDDGLSLAAPETTFQLVGYRAPSDQEAKDAVTGVWTATMESEEIPDGRMEFTLEMKMDDDGNVTGFLSSMMGEMEIYDGKYNEDSKKLRMEISSEESGMEANLVATLKGGTLSGTITAGGGEFEVDFTAERTATDVPSDEPEVKQEETKEVAQTDKPAAEGGARRRVRSDRQEEATAQEETSGDKTMTAADDDPVTGKWEGKVVSESQFMQGDRAKIVMTLMRDKEGKITGFVDVMNNENEISEGSFKAEDNSVDFIVDAERFELGFAGDIKEDKMRGELDFGGRRSFDFEATRVSKTASSSSVASSDDESAGEGSRLVELVPGPRWVSSIEASKYKAGRVYLTLDGHRSNDDEPYLFVSENYGKTWTSIRANLPTSAGCTRVLREDIENENLLFLGCEFSAWVSIDRGKSWTKFKGGLPTVAVHEIAVHPSSGEIVAATHGRSLWIADITGLRKLSTEIMKQPVALMEPNSVIRWRRGNERGSAGTRQFVGQNPDNNAEIYYYIGERIQNATLTIRDLKGELIRTLEADSEIGLHKVDWDLRRESQNAGNNQRGGRGGRGGGGRRGGGGGGVATGKYLVTLSAAGREFKQILEIQQDPEMPPSAITEEEWELMKDLEGVEEEGDDGGSIDD